MNIEFAFDIKSMAIDRIAIFASQKGADVFLREVYPHYPNVIIVSADGIYPKHSDLKKKVFEAILNKSDLKAIVFNLSALKDIAIKTERILVMDDLIMQDYKDHPAERLLQINFTIDKIIFLMDNFFRQWEKMARIGNINFAYDNFKEYNKDKFDWKRELLSNNQEHGVQN